MALLSIFVVRLQLHGYKLGFCGYISDSLGVGNFRRILGLVDAFTIGLSVSMGGLDSLQK